MDQWVSNRLSEITGAELSSLEAHFQDQMMFVLWLYGAVFFIGFILLALFTLRVQRQPLDWQEPVHRLGWRPWSWRSAAVVVVPLLAIQLLFITLFHFGGALFPDAVVDNERAMIVMQSLMFHWAGFFLIVLSLHFRRLSWRAAFGVSGRGAGREAGWGLLIMTGVMPLLIGYNVVAQMVMEWFGYEPPVQEVTRIIHGASDFATKAYFALLAVVIAPLVEEMLFRGILLPVLARGLGAKAAIIIVSVLFAAVHGHAPSAVPLFMLSASLCLAYIYRGSLLTSIAMHSFFNSMTIAVILRS